MDGREVLRLVDALHKDRNIDKEVVFRGIEAALLSAARKHYGLQSEVSIVIDRDSGEIHAVRDSREIDPAELGRIAAQTAKQVMIQKIREAECEVIREEYSRKVGGIVNGTVQRADGGRVIVDLGRAEGLLMRQDQIPGETFRTGDHIRAIVTDVRDVNNRVRIFLSRSSSLFVQRLFELEVPEIAEGIVEIKAIAREPGHRTKVAVVSHDPKVDPTGACVGMRGSRIRGVRDEIGGERVDIVVWSPNPEEYIANALKPAQVSMVELDPSAKRARVFVLPDQLSLAIGKKGQNIRLAGKLVQWDLDVTSLEKVEEKVRQEGSEEQQDESVAEAPQLQQTTPKDEGAGNAVVGMTETAVAASNEGTERCSDADAEEPKEPKEPAVKDAETIGEETAEENPAEARGESVETTEHGEEIHSEATAENQESNETQTTSAPQEA